MSCNSCPLAQWRVWNDGTRGAKLLTPEILRANLRWLKKVGRGPLDWDRCVRRQGASQVWLRACGGEVSGVDGHWEKGAVAYIPDIHRRRGGAFERRLGSIEVGRLSRRRRVAHVNCDRRARSFWGRRRRVDWPLGRRASPSRRGAVHRIGR